MDRLWCDAEDKASQKNGLLSAALLILAREIQRNSQSQVDEVFKGGLASWQVRQCTEYISEHSQKKLAIKEIANLANLSPYHFSRAFKQSTGVPPYQYQLKVRSERAKFLLATTDRSVTDIAFEVGYESSQALARLFRREIGINPNAYRRRSKAGINIVQLT